MACRIWAARAGEMRDFGFDVVVRVMGLFGLLEEATRAVVVSRATPARGGRAIARAPRMLGIGRERRWERRRA